MILVFVALMLSTCNFWKMPSCCAINCTNKPWTAGVRSQKSFHKFPHSHPELMRMWVENIRRDDWVPSKTSLICSDHFQEDCFDRAGQIIRLRDNAVPTIFDYNMKKWSCDGASLQIFGTRKRRRRPRKKLRITPDRQMSDTSENNHSDTVTNDVNIIDSGASTTPRYTSPLPTIEGGPVKRVPSAPKLPAVDEPSDLAGLSEIGRLPISTNRSWQFGRGRGFRNSVMSDIDIIAPGIGCHFMARV